MPNLSSVNMASGPEMEMMSQYVIFILDGQRYALPLAVVRRIVRAVEITPLPEAPAIVLGAINVEGEVLPVFSLRRRFLLPDREIGLDDQFLIARSDNREVALVIDEAQGVIDLNQSDIVASDEVIAGLGQFKGLVRFDDGLVLIHDIETFLSPDEVDVLEQAMESLQ